MGSEELLAVRLRLQEARKFMADAAASAAAIKGISKAADQTKKSVDGGNRSNFAYSQSLYTLRRGAFWATTGLVGLGTAAVVMGFRFNASMESNTLVMGQFLGSTAAAKRELGTLFQLAATGPFEFTNLVGSARQFLAFGFGLKETNRDLRILSDTAAGLQLGGGGIEHLVMVFGQIRASGRLLGQDMLQLQQAGINVRQILQQQLNLSATDMLNLAKGTLSIPSSIAIPALFAGLNRAPSQGGFRGLSSQLQGTFTALTATAHDYASQLFGTITHPWFLDAERSLKQLNPLLLAAGRAYKAGGMDALFQTLDRGVGANGRLVESWREARAIGQDLDRIVRGALIPAFGVLWATIGLGSPPMKLLIGALGLIAAHTTLLKFGLILLTGWFVYTRTAMLLFRVATRLTGIEMLAFTGVTKGSSAAMKYYALWAYRAEAGTLAWKRALLLVRGLGPIAVILSVAWLYEKLGGPTPVIPHSGQSLGERLGGVLIGSEHPIRDFKNKSPLAHLLGLNDARPGRVRQNAPVGNAVAAGIAAQLPPIQPAPLNVDGKKLADIVFNWQQTTAARVTG